MHIAFQHTVADTEIDSICIEQLISQNILKIESILNVTVKWYSENAQIVPNSLKIISLSRINKSAYRLSYHYQWQIFNACLDISETERSEETIAVNVLDNGIELAIVDMTRPTVADEL